MMRAVLLLAIGALAAIGCEKKPEPVPPPTGWSPTSGEVTKPTGSKVN